MSVMVRCLCTSGYVVYGGLKSMMWCLLINVQFLIVVVNEESKHAVIAQCNTNPK